MWSGSSSSSWVKNVTSSPGVVQLTGAEGLARSAETAKGKLISAHRSVRVQTSADSPDGYRIGTPVRVCARLDRLDHDWDDQTRTSYGVRECSLHV